MGSAGPTLPVVPRTPARVEGIWRQGGCHFCPLARREPFTQVAEAICDHCTELGCQGSRQAGGPWPPGCGTWGHGQEAAEWFGQHLCWWEKPRNRVQELRTRVRGARSQGGPWGGVVGSGASCIGAALLLPPDLWQWSFPLPFPSWVGDSSLPRQGPQAAHPGHLQKLRAGQLPFRIPADAWGPGVKRALGCGGGSLRPAPGPDTLYPTLPGPCGQSRSGRTSSYSTKSRGSRITHLLAWEPF